MTILEAIQKSTDFLAKKGVESPRLQSELLLAHVLKTQRLKLYLDFAKALAEAETEQLRDCVKRRAAREPLQHIVGTTSFCGLEMAAGPGALIPRPETEQLAELGWKFLNGLGRPSTFLDFGTGSGCIALALAHFAPQAAGTALERSAEALEVARANTARHLCAARLQILLSDGFAALPAGASFDLIISNPPYIPTGEIDSLQEEVRQFDPRTALDGGSDGLDFYRLLAAEAPARLASGGQLLVEFGDGQEEKLPEILRSAGWQVRSILPDLSAKPRFLCACLS